MDTQITVKTRSFDLLRLSEVEGAVLCAMTNMSDEAISEQMEREFFVGKTSLIEAERVAREMRDTIHKMVWGC